MIWIAEACRCPWYVGEVHASDKYLFLKTDRGAVVRVAVRDPDVAKSLREREAGSRKERQANMPVSVPVDRDAPGFYVPADTLEERIVATVLEVRDKTAWKNATKTLSRTLTALEAESLLDRCDRFRSKQELPRGFRPGEAYSTGLQFAWDLSWRDTLEEIA
ncbi:MAG: hypothetical protein FJ271_05225 [Planctomycetes bacterium]|nr:hypothetical protein [Planctomycetota bacterium]